MNARFSRLVLALACVLGAVPAIAQDIPPDRKLLSELTPAQQEALADALLANISEPVIHEHALHANHNPDQGFLDWHRNYIKQMEDRLRAQNFGAPLVPLPAWDPATEVPVAFRVFKQKPAGQTPQRAPLANFTVANMRPLPADICGIADANALGRDITSWHNSVHNGIGGVMATFDSPAATTWTPGRWSTKPATT